MSRHAWIRTAGSAMVALCLGGIALTQEGATSYEMSTYLSLRPGDRWVYEDRQSGDSLVTVLLSEASFRESPAIERRESDGSTSLQRLDPERGLRTLLTRFSDGGEIEYERGLTVMPTVLEAGETHRSQARYVFRESGEKADVGAHYFEVHLEGVESVTIPMGRFADCLRVRTQAVRVDFSGSETSLELTEWYAPGMGAVKREGRFTRRDASGAVTLEGTIDLVLKEASVGE